MEINQAKYIKEVYDILGKGNFICKDSVNKKIVKIYDDLEDHLTEYQEYFNEIGFTIEVGNGYFHFSRNENFNTLPKKIETFKKWIDILSFIKSYRPNFVSGFYFKSAKIEVELESNIDLREKLKKMYPEKNTEGEKIDKIINELLSYGFVETEDNDSYKVTSAFNYLEELVDCITIKEDDDESTK